MPIDTAPQFISARELAAMTGDSLATFYRRLSAGYYPQPVRFGPRAVKWNLATVTAYLAASERAGRLLNREEWEAMQAVAARQEKQNGRMMRPSDRSNSGRRNSQAVGVTA
jgi:predicted DNA-binding transcriptional regulator AlpA